MTLDKWADLLSEKVCGIDIDGVLNYYPANWINFVNDREVLTKPITDLHILKNELSYNQYRITKRFFRKLGEPGPVREGSALLTEILKGKGFQIYIITSRPFKEYPKLQGDTMKWLDKHNIQYDGIISDPDKHIRILERFPNLAFMIEDHRYYANLVAKWGYKVLLLENQYNMGMTEEKVTRVKSLEEVREWVDQNW